MNAATAAGAQASLADGTWIDNFRVVRRLGRGGFGITYLAEEFREWEIGDTATTPLRQVAIKEFFPRDLAVRLDGQTVSLAPDMDGAEEAFAQALRGFYQEAESLMRFDHPNVVKIYRVFQRNGTAYYVMPMLHGETLKTVLKRDGVMGEERLRRLLLPVLDGLMHAHARGILHRDIKPANIMVPDEGSPVLIDFGAARAQAAEDAEHYTRRSELVAYTPGYAAFEQYGRATRENPHGAHTDVYGLAAVFYHGVSGDPPPDASWRALEIANGRRDPLQPASARLMDSTACSRAFLCAIDWGLELAARDRPQSIADFRKALDARIDLPDSTLDRLARHGVSTEPFTHYEPFTDSRRGDSGHTTGNHSRNTGSRRLPDPASQDFAIETVRATAPVPGLLADTSIGSTMRLYATRSLHAASAPAAQAATDAAAPVQPARRGWAIVGLAFAFVLLAGGYLIWRAVGDRAGLRPPEPGPVESASAPEVVLAPAPLPAAPETPSPPAVTVPPQAPVDPGATTTSGATLIEPAQASAPPPNPDLEAYEAAKAADTLAAWMAFKRAFPRSPYASAADVRIAALTPEAPASRAERAPVERVPAEPAPTAPRRSEREAFEAARATNTIDSWQVFRDAFPHGVNARSAEQQIADLQRRQAPPTARDRPAPYAQREREAFEAARRANTIESWQAFRNAFPDSINATSAKQQIADLKRQADSARREGRDPVPAGMSEREAFAAARAANTIQSWEAFRRAFPDSINARLAEQQIADLKRRARAPGQAR